LWSGFFSSVTSLNLEGVCGLGTGPSVSHVRIFTLETIWPPDCGVLQDEVRVTSAFPTRPIYVRQRTTLEDPSEEVRPSRLLLPRSCCMAVWRSDLQPRIRGTPMDSTFCRFIVLTSTRLRASGNYASTLPA
jgi:hypothetical protein